LGGNRWAQAFSGQQFLEIKRRQHSKKRFPKKRSWAGFENYHWVRIEIMELNLE